MITLASVISLITTLVANADTFVALGGDFEDMFSKGDALINSDTASTPEERAAANATMADLRRQRDARLEELRQQAPKS